MTDDNRKQDMIRHIAQQAGYDVTPPPEPTAEDIHRENIATIAALPADMRELVPEFDDPATLAAWLEKSAGTLAQMAARKEARRLGYLSDDSDNE